MSQSALHDYPDVWYPEPSARSRQHTLRALSWIGHRVQDMHGARLGRLAGVVVDRQTGAPQWLLVGETPERFRCVPLAGVVVGAARVTLPSTKATFRDSPIAPRDGALTARQERELCRLYRVTPTRGARLSQWERRRSSALASADEHAAGGYSWEPPARKERDERSPVPRRQGGVLPPGLVERRRGDERRG